MLPAMRRVAKFLARRSFSIPAAPSRTAPLWALCVRRKKSGALKPGGTIVEGTAGNTGIGLAMVASALGYRTVIVFPRTQSKEKRDAILLAGAELIEVDAVPYANPNHYARYSGQLAEELNACEPNGAIWANQFDNTANRQAHFDTTGPEIWHQTGGKIDGFVAAVGSGGTLAGVGMYLKSKKRRCSDRPCRPGRGGALRLLRPRRAESRRQFDHRRHWPEPHHSQP